MSSVHATVCLSATVLDESRIGGVATALGQVPAIPGCTRASSRMSISAVLLERPPGDPSLSLAAASSISQGRAEVAWCLEEPHRPGNHVHLCATTCSGGSAPPT